MDYCNSYNVKLMTMTPAGTGCSCLLPPWFRSKRHLRLYCPIIFRCQFKSYIVISKAQICGTLKIKLLSVNTRNLRTSWTIQITKLCMKLFTVGNKRFPVVGFQLSMIFQRILKGYENLIISKKYHKTVFFLKAPLHSRRKYTIILSLPYFQPKTRRLKKERGKPILQ